MPSRLYIIYVGRDRSYRVKTTQKKETKKNEYESNQDYA